MISSNVRKHGIQQNTFKKCLIFLVFFLFITFAYITKNSYPAESYPEISKHQLKDVTIRRPTTADNQLNKTENYLIRKSYDDLNELMYFVRSNYEKEDFIDNFQKQLSAALTNVEDILHRNNQWKKNELKKLSEIVQHKIYAVQNPPDCETSNRLTCKPQQRGCGFGCQIHWMLYCFTISHGSGRTFVPHSSFLQNYNGQGWSSVLLPLSENCQHLNMQGENNMTIVELPIHGDFSTHPPYTPIDVPDYLLEKLERLHTSPALWYMGQFVKYMMKPKQQLQEKIEKFHANAGGPLVGLHVRRGDKITETSFVDISQYMFHVENWYRNYELKLDKKGETLGNLTKRIFLATDEKSLLADLKKKYPAYEFVSNENYRGRSASGLEQIVSDVKILSQCDYVVCTFSSNICRLVYELMQGTNEGYPHKLQSVDDSYYYYIQGFFASTNQQAVLNHVPRNKGEIELKIGDVISVPGSRNDARKSNLLNGYSTGRNVRTGKTGLYPSYKTFDTASAGSRWTRVDQG